MSTSVKLPLHHGVSDAQYQTKHEAFYQTGNECFHFTVTVKKNAQQKDAKKEGKAKYVPSNIAKLCSKGENKVE